MTGLVLVLAGLVGLFVLWRFELLPKGSKRDRSDVGVALRELLLAKASGNVSAEEYARQEALLHAALLDPSPDGRGASRFAWMIPAVLVVAGAIAFFVQGPTNGGTPGTAIPPEPPMLGTGGVDNRTQANSGGDLSTMVKRLADKMEKDPNNGEGWLLLARTYNELHQSAEAAKAYARAAALLPPDPNLLADWADAHVVSNDRKWDDEARKIVKRALATDPKHLKSLALAGSEAFDRSDYKGAIAFWKRMLAVAPPDSMDAKLAEANIQEATAMLGGKKSTAAEPESGIQLSGVAGTVTLDPKLKDKFAAGDAVFVFAKSTDGSGPPLAAKRLTVADLPAKFSLSDADAMVPGRKLSLSQQVTITARVSPSGNALAQPGDAESTPIVARIGASGLKIEIQSKNR